MIHPRQTVVLLFAAAATLTLGACGGPGAPTPTPSVSIVPGPTPTPALPSGTCRLGKGTAASVCQEGEGALQAAVEEAVNQVIASQPQFFALNDQRGPGEFRVVSRDGFIESVLRILQGRSMCAARIPQSDAIEVKDSNDYSEEYLLVSERGFVARGKSNWLKTCTPAAFPLDVGDPVVRIFIGMFRFRCTDGVVPPATFLNVVPMQCDALITATPKDKDGHNVPSWLHSDNPEIWVRDGENSVIVLGEVPNEPFNKWIYPKGPGTFSICAAVDGKQTCMNANVVP